MSLDGRSHGIPLRGLSQKQLREVGYFGIWPNLLVSPHPDYVLTHRIEPLAPDLSYVECEWLFPPELVRRDDFDPSWAVEFWDVTNREDWAACESLQRAAASRGHRPGPLSAGWEGGVYLMTTMLARSYLEGGHAATSGCRRRPSFRATRSWRASVPETDDRSVAFDRAADYYDRTRGLTEEGQRRTIELLSSELGGRGRVLEIGVGTGQLALPLRAAGVPVVGLDLAMPMLSRAVAKSGGPELSTGAGRCAAAAVRRRNLRRCLLPLGAAPDPPLGRRDGGSSCGSCGRGASWWGTSAATGGHARRSRSISPSRPASRPSPQVWRGTTGRPWTRGCVNWAPPPGRSRSSRIGSATTSRPSSERSRTGCTRGPGPSPTRCADRRSRRRAAGRGNASDPWTRFLGTSSRCVWHAFDLPGDIAIPE